MPAGWESYRAAAERGHQLAELQRRTASWATAMRRLSEDMSRLVEIAGGMVGSRRGYGHDG